MVELEIRPLSGNDTRRKYAADSPIDFATWLELSHTLDTELIQGVMVDRRAAQYPHEWIFAWLFTILSPYVIERGLGKILGSRTAVKIRDNDGRLPDIIFIRADNAAIVHKDAVYGTPDLVIEIVSENDRPSDLIPLEADYRDIGVPEIVFIDPRKKRVRYLRKQENGYDETPLTTGRLTFAAVPGFWIEVEWLFLEDKPNAYQITKNLIETPEE